MKRPPALSSRTRLALWSGLGGAMVLLPLGQALRYQSAELESVAAQRAALDPLGVVVGVQRGVLAHRDTADRVLRGRTALEPERRERQAELDERLRTLQDTLSAGWWVRALQESQSLADDWHRLARRVALRQVNASGSLEGHQLLMEQAVQVLDLVQAAAPTPASRASATLLAQAVKPLAARTELGAAQWQQSLASLQAALQSQDAVLQAHEAALREQRAALLLALGALLSLGLTLALTLRKPGSPSPRRDDAEQRRSHGRRATDGAPQRDEAAPLLQRLRSGDVPSSFEPR